MERRKFILGTGALAAGGAAAIGSGAFTNATARREVSVDTTGDAVALVGLETTSPYAEYDGDDKLVINFEELNQDADFTFEDVFRIRNNGTQTVNLDRINEDGWYNVEDNGFNVLVANEVNTDQADVGRYAFVSGAQEPDLEPGDFISIGFGFFGGGDDVGEFGSDGELDITDAPETLTFNLGG